MMKRTIEEFAKKYLKTIIICTLIQIYVCNNTIVQAVTINSDLKFTKNEIKDNPNGETKLVIKEVARNDEFVEVQILNYSNEAKYLFSSYFYDNAYKSMYLHMYDKDKNVCILSFLPIPYFLSFTKSDVLILGERAVSKQFQILYEFEKLSPQSYISLTIPLVCFEGEYVRKYNPQTMSRWIAPKFKKNKKMQSNPNLIVQFAVYDSVRKLNKDSFYNEIYSFEKESVGYTVISLIIE